MMMFYEAILNAAHLIVDNQGQTVVEGHHTGASGVCQLNLTNPPLQQLIQIIPSELNTLSVRKNTRSVNLGIIKLSSSLSNKFPSKPSRRDTSLGGST